MAKTSNKGLLFIKNEEGFVNHIYNDFAGVPSIGIGHAIKAGETFTLPMSEEAALALLRTDVSIAESNVNSLVKVSLTQNEYDALVSFTFNLGGNAFKSSTLLKLLNAGDRAAAAEEFLKWCKAHIDGVLQSNQVLLRRRKRERVVFLTPDELEVVVEPVVPPIAVIPVPEPPIVNVPAPIVVIPPPLPRPSGLFSILLQVAQFLFNLFTKNKQ